MDRETERAQKAHLREQARFYTEFGMAQADTQNEQLEQTTDELNQLLASALMNDAFFDLGKLKKPRPQLKAFDPGELGITEDEPKIDYYLPKPLTAVQKLIPGAMQKFEQAVQAGGKYYQRLLREYREREAQRLKKLAEAQAKVEQIARQAIQEVETHNAKVEQFRRDFFEGKRDVLVNFFTLVLKSSSYPEQFPQQVKLAFVPESKQLVVDYQLPTIDIVPEVATYKYVKTKDEITSTKRPIAHRKSLYVSVTAQVALRTIHELFEADRPQHLETIVFNGYVESVDRATGRDIRPYVISVRTTRDTFGQIDLNRVDPILCLKKLNASVSRSPDELEPVRPIIEFNMVDKRFIQETDVLSTLDQRPNLMDLTPSEFESLITNLFAKRGLETRLTQASRDGGVDCVAYNLDPILGGKVVIQAKRYKNTVGVSAVRDLFGAVDNERATKGILVTTSGYSKAAYEFAEGKQLQLLSGVELLFLLEESAGVKAKIVIPEDWKDLNPDSPGQ